MLHSYDGNVPLASRHPRDITLQFVYEILYDDLLEEQVGDRNRLLIKKSENDA
jgi:hypothetical protein